MLKLKLHWQILIALVLAAAAGAIHESLPVGLAHFLLDTYEFVGKLFLNALKMLIVPLIVSSMIVGVGNLGGEGGFGRLGARTIVYYLSTSLIAILIGLVMVNVMQPGIDADGPVRDKVGFSAETASVTAKVQDRGAGDVVEVFIRMIPTNVVAAAADGQMLGLIFFSLLFGYFMVRIADGPAKTLLGFWTGVFEVMMRITELVMRFAPLGVFALVAKVISTTGFAALLPLLSFALTVLIALGLHIGVALPLILRMVGGVSPIRMYRAMSPALLTAFSTASSSATLPVTMDCVQANAGVSNRTASFVLPLGATVNMDGTALYECVAAIFIAQAYGLDLSLAQQFTIVWVALVTSIGVAGIPAASLVAITIILGIIGLPLEAIGLILAVDRVLDMCRTSVNVFSDSCGSVVIARLEGERPLASEPSSGRV